MDDNTATHLTMKDMHQACPHQRVRDLQIHENGEPCSSASPCQDDIPGSNSIPDSLSIKWSSFSHASMRLFKQKHFNEQHLPQGMIHLRNGTHSSETKVSSIPAQHAYPYYISGVVDHFPMPSLAQLYQKNLQDLQNHASTTMITALMKFRQKRKERCFDKKIRYVNRK